MTDVRLSYALYRVPSLYYLFISDNVVHSYPTKNTIYRDKLPYKKQKSQIESHIVTHRLVGVAQYKLSSAGHLGLLADVSAGYSKQL